MIRSRRNVLRIRLRLWEDLSHEQRKSLTQDYVYVRLPSELSSKEMEAESEKYIVQELLPGSKVGRYNHVEVIVQPCSLTEAVQFAKVKPRNPSFTDGPAEKIVAVNIADANFPGGGLMTGELDCESTFCMTTSLFWSLGKKVKVRYYKFYRFKENQLLYTPEIKMMRQVPLVDLPRADKFNFDVISYPIKPEGEPPHTYEARDGKRHYISINDRDKLETDLRAIFRLASIKGGTTIVFDVGAFVEKEHSMWDVTMTLKDVLASAEGDGDDWTANGLETVIITVDDFDRSSETWRALAQTFRIVSRPNYYEGRLVD